MAQSGIAEPEWNGLNRGMAQAGMAEPEHAGTGTSHSSFGAQLNREGVQANWDTTESGHGEEAQATRHGQSPALPQRLGAHLWSQSP